MTVVSVSSFAMNSMKYSFIPSDFSNTKEYIQVESIDTHNFAEECALKVQRKKKEISNRIGGEIGNARVLSAMEDVVNDEEKRKISEIYYKPIHKITQDDIELFREFDKCITPYEKQRRVYFKKCKQISENSVRCEAIGDTFGYTENQITRSGLMNLSIAGAVFLVETGVVILAVPRSFGLAFMAARTYLLRRSTLWATDVALAQMTALAGIAGAATTATIINYGISNIDSINPMTWYERYNVFSMLDADEGYIFDEAQLLSRKEKDMLRLSESFNDEDAFEVINYMDLNATELKEIFDSNLGLLKSADSRFK